MGGRPLGNHLDGYLNIVVGARGDLKEKTIDEFRSYMFDFGCKFQAVHDLRQTSEAIRVRSSNTLGVYLQRTMPCHSMRLLPFHQKPRLQWRLGFYIFLAWPLPADP